MANKKDLIKFCRYFKGEAEPSKETNVLFWEYEKVWVELSENPKEDSENFKMVGNWLDDYLRAGLSLFKNDDGRV